MLPSSTPWHAELEHPLFWTGFARRRAITCRWASWVPISSQVRFELDALASFGFGVEQHPYRGAAYTRPGPAALPRPDRAWAGDATDRPADRGLEPGHEHQRPGRAGGHVGVQRRPGGPGRRADGRPRSAGTVVVGSAVFVDLDVGRAVSAAAPGRRVARGGVRLRLADRAGCGGGRRSRDVPGPAARPRSSGPTMFGSRGARSPASWSNACRPRRSGWLARSAVRAPGAP